MRDMETARDEGREMDCQRERRFDRREYDMEFTTMPKYELAQMYAPELTVHSAVNRLMHWIQHHPQLWHELLLTGYRKNAKLFSPRQVELIVEFLGEP